MYKYINTTLATNVHHRRIHTRSYHVCRDKIPWIFSRHIFIISAHTTSRKSCHKRRYYTHNILMLSICKLYLRRNACAKPLSVHTHMCKGRLCTKCSSVHMCAMDIHVQRFSVSLQIQMRIATPTCVHSP